MSIYTQLRAIGAQLDHHASDLYVRDCDEVRTLLRHCDRRHHISTFYSNDQLWYDVPFAFDPYWEAVEARWEHVTDTGAN